MSAAGAGYDREELPLNDPGRNTIVSSPAPGVTVSMGAEMATPLEVTATVVPAKSAPGKEKDQRLNVTGLGTNPGGGQATKPSRTAGRGPP